MNILRQDLQDVLVFLGVLCALSAAGGWYVLEPQRLEVRDLGVVLDYVE